jgi:CRP-like cAMP-binding protein
MLGKVIHRARLCQRELAHFALSSVYARVSAVLLNHALNVAGEHRVEAGSEQIAGLVGSSREMVSRVLKKMIEQGLIRRSGRTLYVVDRQALKMRSTGVL